MRQATTKPASILAGLWGSTARSMLVGPRVPQSRRPAVPQARSPGGWRKSVTGLPGSDYRCSAMRSTVRKLPTKLGL